MNQTFFPILLLALAVLPVRAENKHSPSSRFPSYEGRVMCGYQGWFRAPDDGAKRGPWWQLFNDPVLNELEGRVESSNQSIRQAVAMRDIGDQGGVQLVEGGHVLAAHALLQGIQRLVGQALGLLGPCQQHGLQHAEHGIVRQFGKGQFGRRPMPGGDLRVRHDQLRQRVLRQLYFLYSAYPGCRPSLF